MMTSNRPYLMRAIYEWILDNDMTPHVLIDATMQDVDVPQHYVEDGRIILNISPSAVQQFAIDDNCLVFNARFGGRPSSIYAPIDSIRAIYAAENSEGMMFEALPQAAAEVTDENDGEPDPEPPAPPPQGKRPALRVVK